MMRRNLVAVGAAALLALTAGCATTASPRDESAAQPPLDSRTVLTAEGRRALDLIRDGMNYVVYTSPDELRRARSAAYLGEVQEIAQGRTLLSETDGDWTRDNFVVVRIKVVREIEELAGANSDGMIYVSMPRGINSVTADGTIIGVDPNPSVRDLQRLLPPGLRVMVISQPEDPRLALRDPVTTVENDPVVAPDGVPLLDGFHPQAVVFDQGDEKLAEWPDYTFEELVADAADR